MDLSHAKSVREGLWTEVRRLDKAIFEALGPSPAAGDALGVAVARRAEVRRVLAAAYGEGVEDHRLQWQALPSMDKRLVVTIHRHQPIRTLSQAVSLLRLDEPTVTAPELGLRLNRLRARDVLALDRSGWRLTPAFEQALSRTGPRPPLRVVRS